MGWAIKRGGSHVQGDVNLHIRLVEDPVGPHTTSSICSPECVMGWQSWWLEIVGAKLVGSFIFSWVRWLV